MLFAPFIQLYIFMFASTLQSSPCLRGKAHVTDDNIFVLVIKRIYSFPVPREYNNNNSFLTSKNQCPSKVLRRETSNSLRSECSPTGIKKSMGTKHAYSNVHPKFSSSFLWFTGQEPLESERSLLVFVFERKHQTCLTKPRKLGRRISQPGENILSPLRGGGSVNLEGPFSEVAQTRLDKGIFLIIPQIFWIARCHTWKYLCVENSAGTEILEHFIHQNL